MQNVVEICTPLPQTPSRAKTDFETISVLAAIGRLYLSDLLLMELVLGLVLWVL